MTLNNVEQALACAYLISSSAPHRNDWDDHRADELRKRSRRCLHKSWNGHVSKRRDEI